MYYFGIDWSQDHHDLCILNRSGARVSQVRFENSFKGFERIEAERRLLDVPAVECPVAIETSYHLVVDFLLDHDYVIYIIPPQATKSYRNRHRSSGAHTDKSDAALLASILITDRDSHRLWQPNEPLTQEMLAQVRLIETLRRSIQRQRSQLRAVLLRTYPHALDLFGKLTAQIMLRFLFDFPTAQQAQALSLEAFTNWCKDQCYSRPDLISRRYVHLQEPALQANPTVTRAYRNQVRILASVLLPQVRHRQQTLARLGRLFARHPDAFIFDSLPGTGELLAPALLTKFGDHRERFRTSAEVQALAGTCPVTERSGKRRRVKFRRGCDKEFRRIAQQFALCSVAQSGWAAAYWAEARSRCDSDSHAYRCLANRWLVIIWKMWQDRKPYDEAYHIQQRASRRRPRSRC